MKVKKEEKGNRQDSVKSVKDLEIKKKFEVFAQGVERLKQLEAELNSIDTSNFSREEKDISSRLKSVSEIPYIESKLKELKRKIAGKNKVKSHKGPNKITLAIKEGVDEIRGEELPEIKKGINGLSSLKREVPAITENLKSLNTKLSSVTRGRQQLLDGGVSALVDNNFKDFLGDVKVALSARILSKEKNMNETLSNDLKKREEIFKKKYGSLVKEFNIKRKNIEEEMNKKYNFKVKSSLQKEVSEKFNEELQRKIDSIKVQIGKKYREELRLHADERLKKEEQFLKNKIRLELEKLQKAEEKLRLQEQTIKLATDKRLELEEDKLKREERFMKNQTAEKMQEYKEKSQKYDIKFLNLKQKLDEERKKLNSERVMLESKAALKIKENDVVLARKIKENEKDADMKIRENEKDVAMKIKENENDLATKIKTNEEKLQKLKQSLQKEKTEWEIRTREKIASESHLEIEKEVVRKELQLRKKLGEEFDIELEQKIAQHEAELKKKKKDLEIEVQKKIKQLLG